ncbi:stAR-related lipid transfer protein 7, mitochondrial-like [Littorina saxatilis]
MASEGVCSALRLAWTRYLIYTHRFSSQNTPVVARKRFASLAFGASGTQKAKQLAENLSNKVQEACSLFTSRCNVIAGQRVWRAFQIAAWYQQLYGEKLLLQTLRANLLRHCKNRNLYMLLSAAGIFQWERDGVADKELQSALSEMEEMERLVEHASKSKAKHAAAPEGWELVIDRQHLKVWRRFMEDYNLFEYRVFGSFKDITPMAFYNVQMDLKFWCGWDPQTMEINVVDTDPKSSSEIIHWVYKYPYPMLPRDYCYVRRSTVNDQKNRIVIRAKAVPHHKCPEVNNIVRVHQYQSQLVIEPVSSFSENGFSFYMTYFDNPQTQLPSMCYNWLASTGVPDFVDRLHKASKVMQERTNRGYRPNILVSSHSSEQK